MVSSYRKLKIKDYIALQSISKELDTLDRDVERLVILTGKTRDYFEGLSFNKLQGYITKIQWLDRGMPKKVHPIIWVNGRRYKAKTHASEYSTKSYLAFKAYGKDPNANLHNILAWIYRPTWGKFNTDKAAKDFLDHCKIGQVYGCFFLFSRILQKQKVILEFSAHQAMTILKDHLQELTRFSNTMAGITP